MSQIETKKQHLQKNDKLIRLFQKVESEIDKTHIVDIEHFWGGSKTLQILRFQGISIHNGMKSYLIKGL